MAIMQHGHIAIAASATLLPYRLVTAAGAYCALDTTPDHVGVTTEHAASGESVTVRLPNAGTVKLTASEAIAAGAQLYKAADGKVSDVATSSVLVGIAITAASADGSIFEALLR
jgi:hypothetical protein